MKINLNFRRMLTGAMAFVAAAFVFGSCTKNESGPVGRSTVTHSLREGSNAPFDIETAVKTFSPVPMSQVDIVRAFDCNQELWDVINSMDPEAQQMLLTDYPWLKGYWIKMTHAFPDGYYGEVMILQNDSTGVTEVLLQKHDGPTTENAYTGTYILQDVPTGREILHNTYANGVRTSEINRFPAWEADETGCRVGTSGGNYFRRCTREQFNALYQKGKAECEADWVCDVACAMAPCRISYLMHAMIECW